MAYIKALFLLAAVVVAAYGAEEPARVKKQILVSASDDGSYWPGKYDVRELSPALGALPDGVAVRTAIPALGALPAGVALRSAVPALEALPAGVAWRSAIPALAAPAIPTLAHSGIPTLAARALPGLALPAHYPYLI